MGYSVSGIASTVVNNSSGIVVKPGNSEVVLSVPAPPQPGEYEIELRWFGDTAPSEIVVGRGLLKVDSP
jgi:hypothetical protein